MEKDRYFKVVDESGVEHDMYILFTTSLDEFNKNYIFYTDPNDEDGQVYASSYDDKQHLYPIENDKEWDLLEEVFEQFMQERKEHHCSNCNGDCDGSCEGDCDGHCDGNCNH